MELVISLPGRSALARYQRLSGTPPWVVDGFAAVSLALACVNSKVVMVSRLHCDVARYHPPGPQLPGKHGWNPLRAQRQRRVQSSGKCSDSL